jgi:hypothetical protein
VAGHLGSKGFTFCGVTSNNSTTDGFYVGPTDNADASTFPEDGVFADCHADFNYRQGMSIINGRRLQVIDSSFTNTFGTSPQAGVDIEPNSGSAEPGIEHVLFRGCLFEGNEGYGLTMARHDGPTDGGGEHVPGEHSRRDDDPSWLGVGTRQHRRESHGVGGIQHPRRESSARHRCSGEHIPQQHGNPRFGGCVDLRR